MCDNYFKDLHMDNYQFNKIYELAQAKGVAYSDYDSIELAKTTVSNKTVGRQWTYQYCTMFGWFQTPSSETKPARSNAVELSFWRDYCRRIYGSDVMKPSPDYVNKHLGSRDMSNGTNTFFFNALEDPW